jgi:NitT/TauT family transport system substrate-binding protein
MRALQADGWTRRRFLSELTVAGTVGLLGLHPWSVAAEPPPETTTIRLIRRPTSICIAPEVLAAELLPGEGFTDVQYLEKDHGPPIFQALATGEVDLTMAMTASLLTQIDAGAPIVLVAGLHVGCYELVGGDRVRAIRDLKGKTVAINGRGTGEHVFLAAIAAYVGLNPQQDIQWVEHASADAMPLLAEGTIDAFLALPPVAQEARAKQIGRVLLKTAVDRPWSQYFCCVVAGNREFVRRHPVATKRALRAILKSADICALEPDRVARFLVDHDYTPHYSYTLEALQEIPYQQWRTYDPEDTVRFFALRLHEMGVIKNTPQKLIAQGTDWRFLNELKKELKG